MELIKIQMQREAAEAYGVEYEMTDNPNIVMVPALSMGNPDDNYWEGAPGWEQRIAELE